MATHIEDDHGGHGGHAPHVSDRTPAFVITINWQGHKANLVIAVRAAS